MLKKFGVEVKVVADQWPKVGTLDLTSHVAALKAAKPDLIFSSLLFADKAGVTTMRAGAKRS